MKFKKASFEYLREQANTKFNKVKPTWIDLTTWAAPHRGTWLQSMQEPGERVNRHIVDTSHLIARRSYVAGFLEGNTSASRPWYMIRSQDDEANKVPENNLWLQTFTTQTLKCLARSNFYLAAAQIYDDYALVNTAVHYIDEIGSNLFFHTLEPGTYKLINNGRGEAVVFIREFQLSVKAIVETYGKYKNQKYDWSNFSEFVKEAYEQGNYSIMVDVVHIVCQNKDFDPEQPQVMYNRPWISVTYEAGSRGGQYYAQALDFGANLNAQGAADREKFLNIAASKRKPFIVARATGGNFEYGVSGPTLDSLGLIKSLNKKAIAKDVAIDMMLKPPVQGPASLKKSYLAQAPGSFTGLDPQSLAATKGVGLRQVFEVNPAIGTVIQDVEDLRNQVEKNYFADFLLYLTRNPKTRTATETNAVLNEQQLIIGPNLQSLNWTYNIPVVEFVMDFVLEKDPFLPPPPPGLAGKFLTTEFISVFAQAQKAADLPAIERYVQMIMNIGQPNGLGAQIWDKINLDELADLYASRLYLPEGLNNPQAEVDAKRQQAQAAAQRQQMLQQTLPAMAGAAKDVGLQVQQPDQG